MVLKLFKFKKKIIIILTISLLLLIFDHISVRELWSSKVRILYLILIDVFNYFT